MLPLKGAGDALWDATRWLYLGLRLKNGPIGPFLLLRAACSRWHQDGAGTRAPTGLLVPILEAKRCSEARAGQHARLVFGAISTGGVG